MSSTPPEAGAKATPGSSMAGAAGRFGLATMLSRVLGLVREQLFAALVGAGAAADAFVVAFRIPNLLRDLFAEGALSAAFVPAFTDYRRNRSHEEAWLLASRVVNLVVLVLGVIVLLGSIFAEDLVYFLAARFDADRAQLSARLTRIMLPFLPVVSLAAVAMGMLTSQGRFGAPALAPALFNVVSIVVGAGLYLSGADAQTAVVGWSVGTLLGGVAQLLIQLPPLRATGWRYVARSGLGLSDPGVRRIARLMGPATIGLAATQLNIVVNTYFASGVPGAPAWLQYAFRLMQLPIGVFGVAIATVAAAGIARHAAARDRASVDATLGTGLRLVAFLTVPATLLLAALAEPIVRLLYERGAFTAHDTEQTALALLGYTVGLYAYAAVKVAAPAFYALDRPRLPMTASLLAVGVNVILNAALFPVIGFAGLALGTSAAALANFGVLLLGYRRIGGRLGAASLLGHLARVLAAGSLAAGAAWATATGVDRALGHATLLANLSIVGAALFVGGATYAVTSAAMRLSELQVFGKALVRRLRQ